jgi:hypothetical protein
VANPDAWHPERWQCRDREALKKAYLEFWNGYYTDARVGSFEEMVR